MRSWKQVTVDDSRMACYLAEPEVANGAAILVCMHGPGVDDFMREICERFASNGFTALAPDFYHRQSEPRVEPGTKMRDKQALRDMATAMDEIAGLSSVDPQRLGVVGFCMGGRLAFLYAAVQAAVKTDVNHRGTEAQRKKDREENILAHRADSSLLCVSVSLWFTSVFTVAGTARRRRTRPNSRGRPNSKTGKLILESLNIVL